MLCALTCCKTNGIHSIITASFNTLTLQLCYNIIFTLASCHWPEIWLNSLHCGHIHTNTSSLAAVTWTGSSDRQHSPTRCHSSRQQWRWLLRFSAIPSESPRTLLLTPLNRAALLVLSPPHTEMWGMTSNINISSLFLRFIQPNKYAPHSQPGTECLWRLWKFFHIIIVPSGHLFT